MKNLLLIVLVVLMTSFKVGNELSIEVKGVVYSSFDGNPLEKVEIKVKDSSTSSITDSKGQFSILVPGSKNVLIVNLAGYDRKEVKIKGRTWIEIYLDPAIEDDMIEYEMAEEKAAPSLFPGKSKMMGVRTSNGAGYVGAAYDAGNIQYNTESYDAIEENIFHKALSKPLSTFSIDVDAASYSNIRRFINYGQKPPKDAVRIEEMINYFSYDYPQPDNKHPFSIYSEISACPWNSKHKLVHIGLQGKHIPTEDLPPSNLVFLLDVSGSMSSPNKLPLLKSAFRMLVQNIREEDRVAIVVYAGAAGVVLPSTAGNERTTILEALNKLEAGGSTAGGQGIKLAYKIAQENFLENGNNRIILATDGDFNIGASSNGEMQRLIEEKRKSGVYLTVLGFGMGNYKDSKMEILADKGNGNYAYIDNAQEARKVLVNEFGGTLFTIAKDVKIQIEFNPTKIQAYRLIGYENRKLNDEDFNDDKKDAGELGAGHTVTALYEIIPAGVKSDFLKDVDELRYQKNELDQQTGSGNELMMVKLRYKQPDGFTSKLIENPIKDKKTGISERSDNFRFSAAVAGFGMLLRDSEFKGELTYDDIVTLAKGSMGEDKEGYRAEFIKLVRSAQSMAEM
ncbi:von Willebrand factor type A domain-containing protein [Bacteroidota bacterium]